MNDTQRIHALVEHAISAWAMGGAHAVERQLREAGEYEPANFVRDNADRIDAVANDLVDLAVLGATIKHRDMLLTGVDRPHLDYVNEVEHQDGYDYWWKFTTPEELRRDLLYWNNEGDLWTIIDRMTKDPAVVEAVLAAHTNWDPSTHGWSEDPENIRTPRDRAICILHDLAVE